MEVASSEEGESQPLRQEQRHCTGHIELCIPILTLLSWVLLDRSFGFSQPSFLNP